MYTSGRPVGGVHDGWPPSLRCLVRERRVGELLVGRTGVGRAVLEAAHGLDTTGDEDVALPRLDRVRGHADGLQRRRAVAVDGDARRVDAGEDAGDTPDVGAGFARGLPATPDHVFDERAIELGNLREHRVDDEPREVVGPAVDQRSLVGPPDRRAGRGDDHCFGHPELLGARVSTSRFGAAS